MRWPRAPAALLVAQQELAGLRPEPWSLPGADLPLGGCFVCFAPGRGWERAWAAAVLMRPGREPVETVIGGRAGAAYTPGLLALREGPLLEEAVRALPAAPGVLLVNATGLDHPRRAGLALHLGAALDLPTVGVTDRTLVASGALPGPAAGASSPLVLGGDVVGFWLRTRAGVRPVAVHAAWRTDPRTAVDVVRRAPGRMRTPGPIRLARRAARRARADALG